MGENSIDEFPTIRQYFPYQNFTFIAPATNEFVAIEPKIKLY